MNNCARTNHTQTPLSPSVRNANQFAAICGKAGVELLLATGVIMQRWAAFQMQNPAVCVSSLTRLVRRYQLSPMWFSLF